MPTRLAVRGAGCLGPWRSLPVVLYRRDWRLCRIAGRMDELRARGDLAMVCSRSVGSRRPRVCGKSPKEIAFAVPMWARGYYSETPATVLESCGPFRPRGRPPAFLVGASSPKPRRSDSVQSARNAAW